VAPPRPATWGRSLAPRLNGLALRSLFRSWTGVTCSAAVAAGPRNRRRRGIGGTQ